MNDVKFTKIVTLWIPKRFLKSSGCDLNAFITDVNQKVIQRGFVLCDRQLLTTPITKIDGIELTFEGVDLRDTPPVHEWGATQQEYFNLKNPYQMIEDSEAYTWSHITANIDEKYLKSDEQIIGILHGKRDNHYFYCTCHHAQVVYTTRKRLICMGCGALHLVLKTPLLIQPKNLLTSDEWADLFDDDGERLDEEVDLNIIDFQDVESVDTIWTTNQWEDSKQDFIFFARSSPEEIQEAIRGTEADPSIFVEAGWTPVSTPPPPALQISSNSVDVDLLENAAHSLQEGVTAYIAARKEPQRLLDALPHLSKAVELIFKAKLQELNTTTLINRPSIPKVMKDLVARGVAFSEEETVTISKIRRLRNDLQHGTANFNHRAGLSLCRKTITFLNCFVDHEMGLWIGDSILSDDWLQLLRIPEVSKTAKRIVDERVLLVRQQIETSISKCPRCARNTLVRTHQNTGASCFYCHYIPVLKDKDEDLK